MSFKRNKKQQRIMGIWGLGRHRFSLGGLLILIEELQIQRLRQGADYADIAIVADNGYPGGVNLGPSVDNPVRLIDENMENAFPSISAAKSLEGVNACYVADSIGGLENFIGLHSYLAWPRISEKDIVDHDYESTLFIQQFYRDRGFIPYLSCKNGSLRWAADFITRHCLSCMPVVVHLKNNLGQAHCSNADFGAWAGFLADSCQKYDAKFILIGNEQIPRQISEMPNVLISKDLGSDLSGDLALIQLSFMFMGMASGPSNMAILNDTPYIIYKDPDHHAEEMVNELAGGSRFLFSTPLQKTLRVFHTSENLISEFRGFYGRIDRDKHRRRLSRLFSKTKLKAGM